MFIGLRIITKLTSPSGHKSFKVLKIERDFFFCVEGRGVVVYFDSEAEVDYFITILNVINIWLLRWHFVSLSTNQVSCIIAYIVFEDDASLRTTTPQLLSPLS